MFDKELITQVAILFGMLVLFFSWGAIANGLGLSRHTGFEIAQAALIASLVWLLLTDWRGCSAGSGGLGSQVILQSDPVKQGLSDGQRGAYLPTQHAANGGLTHANILGQSALREAVALQPFEQLFIDGCLHVPHHTPFNGYCNTA